MQTIELHTPRPVFSRLVSNLTGPHQFLNVAANVNPSIGHHILCQEYVNNQFTGRWIRSRVVDVNTTPTGNRLTLQLLARNSASPVRRRAA
jgi:hypothetical protein